MAVAIVISDMEKEENTRYSAHRTFKCWLKKFSSAEILIENKEVSAGFFIYIITMPHPDNFLLMNRYGKKRTLRNWFEIIKEKQISNYILDKALTIYLEDGWSIGQKDLLKESLGLKIGILSSVEPIKNLECGAMTITVSGIKKEHKTNELLSFLKKFRNINTIEENGFDVWWEEFMTETGVPVCKTTDPGVLQRSDVWLTLDDSNINHFFNGVKVDIPRKKITCTDAKKQYKIGYFFLPRLTNSLGSDVIHRFGYGVLANFLLSSFIAEKDQNLNTAEAALGIDIMIMASRQGNRIKEN